MTASELLIGVQETVPTADLSGFMRTLNKLTRKIARSHRWNFLRVDTDIQLVEGYSDGTVAVTEESADITGTGTTWTSAMTGRKINFSGDLASYTFTQTGATTGTLDRNYAKESDTEATYKIFQDTYAMPSDLMRIEKIINLENGQRTLPVPLGRFIDQRKATMLTPVSVGGRFMWAFFGKDSDGNENILVHRFPGADEFFKVYYIRQPADVTAPETEPDIPGVLHDWLQIELQLHYSLRVPKEQKDPLLIQWLKAEAKDAGKKARIMSSTNRTAHTYNEYNAL